MKQLNWYQIFGNTHTIPEGSTVTPTDDVQILLHCANIWDKSYTTIGEVIADDDTLFLTLIDNNAIDYLVRSTTFASSIVASESAMQYIGASDYASETLLSDSTWLTAIDGSAYKDYVINASVPKMTSDTTPEGECTSNGYYQTYYPYLAFDKNDSTAYISGHGTTIGYKFVRPSCIKYVRYKNYNGYFLLTGNLYGKNEGDADGTLITTFSGNSDTDADIDIYVGQNQNYYQHYYIEALTWNGTASNYISMRTIQFLGRQPAGVQSWLKAGGVEGKKYTTVSEVLSDLTTLATLMASTDAIDYLVTAKGWATEICSDSNAMADIGMNNYCANTLLADETWKEAICNSTYFASVLNVSVPTMTSNTQPYGECYFDGNIYSGSAYNAYDKTTAYVQMTGNSNAVGYSRYRFPSLTKIYKAVVSRMNVNGTSYVGEIAGSLDNVTWDMLDSSQKTAVSDNTFVFPTVGDYYQYRVKLYHHSGTQYDGFVEVQFYGRKDI